MTRLGGSLLAACVVTAPAMAQETEPLPPQVTSPEFVVDTPLRSNLRRENWHDPDTPRIKRPTSGLDHSAIAEVLSNFYPPVSWHNREEGTAYIEMCVDANGRASDIGVFKTSGFKRLDDASLMFIRVLPLKPAMLDGRPVPFCGYLFGVSWMMPPLEEDPPTGALPPSPGTP